MNAARTSTGIWVGLAASYLLFAGQLSVHEVIAGLGASLVVSAYGIAAHRTAAAPLRLRLRWFRLLGGLGRALVVDTVRVGLRLISASPGSLASETLDDDFSDMGQRAVKILALSAAPNGFVVRAENADVQLHRLVPQ